jgi:hypothetical protein
VEAPPAAPPAIVRDVCATADEFARSLRAAMPGAVDSGAGRFEVARGEATIAVGVSVLPPRRLGALALPRIRVAIDFVAGPGDACLALLAEMDRAMQRGGG